MASDTPKAQSPRAARVLVQRIESLQRAGVTHIGRVCRGATPCREADDVPTRPEQAPSVDLPPPQPPLPAAPSIRELPPPASAPASAPEDRAARLVALSRQVAQCARCAELAQTRKQTVFGVGNPHPRLIFLGEAPGADEDRQGEPFVGRAGQLLTKIIEACTMRREDVYIMNVLKCRPPGNRNPLPTEAANCREFLDAQLAILQPEYICCLGAVAAQNLLQTEASIGRMRGKFYLYQGIKVLCTYHPAYLLRNPEAKRPVWEDMQFLMAEMGIELPEKK
jgi:uracil-DNA glycosylase